MVPNLLLYQLLLSTLVLICLIIHVWWPNNPRVTPHQPRQPAKPRRQRSEDPHPFPGLIHKPLCEACEQGADPRPKAPGAPPPVMVFTQGRRRTIDTQQHFCPAPDCSYHGWLGRGNIRANGHPGGQPWRQLQCVSCYGYFYDTHGTIFHGKHASVELIVPHSIAFRGGVYPSSSKASRREDLEIEQPVTCRDAASFDFHPTLASVLGAALIGHQVVQMCEPSQKRLLVAFGMMKRFHHEQFSVDGVMGLIQQGAGDRHSRVFEHRIPARFLVVEPLSHALAISCSSRGRDVLRKAT
jgi:hypothetical protein